MEKFTKRNFDDVFVRNVIVGLTYFLYDTIKIKRIINDEINIITIPILPSETGAEDFLTDAYLRTEHRMDQICKAEGNYNKVPGGIFKITNSGIINSEMVNQERMKYQREVETDLTTETRHFSAMTTLIPEGFNVDIEIKASSEIEKWKIYDSIIENLYKVRKFYFRYNGFEKLPCHIGLPENFDTNKTFQFRFNDNDKRPMIIFTAELKAFRPVIDYTTESETKVHTSSMRTKLRDVSITDNNII